MNFKFFKKFGPGIIMASSAIGGSHIIASTQAGVNYGFKLAFFIIAVNLLKYPFYHFAFKYSLEENESVLKGYQKKGKKYLSIFLIFNLFATVVNIAGGTLLSAALLGLILPFSAPLVWLNLSVLVSFLLILRKQQYHILDIISKNIMLILTVITIIAFILALTNSHNTINNEIIPNPYALSALPFLIALMGWMPSPLELSISTSLWVIEKKKEEDVSVKNGLLDFNVGYIITIILALVFMALGALIQFKQGTVIQGGGKFITQFVDMYAFSIGEWTRWFVSLLAFACIYGTTISAVDGYSRANLEAINLLFNKKNNNLFNSMIIACIISLCVILFFQSSVKDMIIFAMTMSFISAPIFAWLNFSLYLKNNKNKSKAMILWALFGLFYLICMLALYFLVKLQII